MTGTAASSRAFAAAVQRLPCTIQCQGTSHAPGFLNVLRRGTREDAEYKLDHMGVDPSIDWNDNKMVKRGLEKAIDYYIEDLTSNVGRAMDSRLHVFKSARCRRIAC